MGKNHYLICLMVILGIDQYSFVGNFEISTNLQQCVLHTFVDGFGLIPFKL